MRAPVSYAYLGSNVGIALTHRGHRMLVSTADYALSPHIILSGEWERAIEETVLGFIRPGMTVVEVGCNMGYHTLAMADLIGGNGTLYGFEANPEVFRLLRWSVDLNGFSPRCRLHNYAVSNEAGTAMFRFEREAVGGGHITKDTNSDGKAQVISVKTETLDASLADIPKVDVWRMDAEGSEGLIIEGAKSLIARSPNLVIVTEWAPSFMRSRGTDPGATVKTLYDFGFKASRIDGANVLTPLQMHDLVELGHCELAFRR